LLISCATCILLYDPLDALFYTACIATVNRFGFNAVDRLTIQISKVLLNCFTTDDDTTRIEPERRVPVMSIDIQEAIKRSIQTEKNAMNFYQAGAGLMKDTEARRVFELLAREEREHAGQFYRIYKGDNIPSLEAFLDAAPDNESGWMASISKIIAEDCTEQKALEVAMEREQNLEQALLETAAKLDDPGVRVVYELNARETHNHYQLIESQYARIMGMVHETDIDTFVRE